EHGDASIEPGRLASDDVDEWRRLGGGQPGGLVKLAVDGNGTCRPVTRVARGLDESGFRHVGWSSRWPRRTLSSEPPARARGRRGRAGRLQRLQAAAGN